MIFGLHALVYVPEADRVRAFLRDVLGYRAVDAGHGWLIFAMPPAELGVHPADGDEPHTELYLMCDDLDATMAELRAKGVTFVRGVTEAGFGRMTAIALPGGGALGLYQPRHALAIPGPSR